MCPGGFRSGLPRDQRRLILAIDRLLRPMLDAREGGEARQKIHGRHDLAAHAAGVLHDARSPHDTGNAETALIAARLAVSQREGRAAVFAPDNPWAVVR